MKHNRNSLPERRWFLGVAIMAMVGAAVFITVMIITSDSSFICQTEPIYGEMPRAQARAQEDYNPTTIQIKAILHYATTRIVPQQSLAEIKISFDVLKSMGRPCNFLVFGLGHDSLMWASLNPGGTTLFLEEDPKWVQTVLKDAPSLRAHTVQYRTRLKNADQLLLSYRSEPACGPVRTRLRGNVECELALHNLPRKCTPSSSSYSFLPSSIFASSSSSSSSSYCCYSSSSYYCYSFFLPIYVDLVFPWVFSSRLGIILLFSCRFAKRKLSYLQWPDFLDIDGDMKVGTHGHLLPSLP